ncbi:hypothetical protein H1R20_g8800, partial [Candolleomyces eurysporus]
MWVPRDMITVTELMTRVELTPDIVHGLTEMWQHNARYLPSYVFDWWNYLGVDCPAPSRLSSIREALSACAWDRLQSVPHIEPGNARSSNLREEPDENEEVSLDPSEFTARRMKDAQKQCEAARVRVCAMMETVTEQMEAIRAKLGAAGIELEDPKVVAAKARLVMVKGTSNLLPR